MTWVEHVVVALECVEEVFGEVRLRVESFDKCTRPIQ